MKVKVGDLLITHDESFYLGQPEGTAFRVLEVKDGKVYWACPIFDRLDEMSLEGVRHRFNILPVQLEND